jgi:hypothetical protein
VGVFRDPKNPGVGTAGSGDTDEELVRRVRTE